MGSINSAPHAGPDLKAGWALAVGARPSPAQRKPQAPPQKAVAGPFQSQWTARVGHGLASNNVSPDSPLETKTRRCGRADPSSTSLSLRTRAGTGCGYEVRGGIEIAPHLCRRVSKRLQLSCPRCTMLRTRARPAKAARRRTCSRLPGNT